MDCDTSLKYHLETMAKFMRSMRDRTGDASYASIEEFVLGEGEPMYLTPGDVALRLGTPKECFRNSTTFVLEHPDHVYAEGYVLSPKVPVAIHHAWVLDPDGHVLDPTLGWRQGAAYYGVGFSLPEVLTQIRATGYYGLYVPDGICMSDLVLGKDPHFQYRGLKAA